MVLRQLEIHLQKNGIDILSHIMYEELTVRSQTLKLLEENLGINICDLGFGNGFLGMTAKAQGRKGKKNR